MRRIVGALCIAALVLGACGGSDDEADNANVREGDAESPSEVLGDADEGIPGVQAVRVTYERPVHATGDIDYGLTPPAGGLHAPIWWNCGFYDTPVVDENVVHDLEHGVVLIAYAADRLSEADILLIRDLAQANKVIAAPYPDLPEGEEVVASAWARQLRLDSPRDPRLAQFVERYQDGDQAPERGASCGGSPLGQPVG